MLFRDRPLKSSSALLWTLSLFLLLGVVIALPDSLLFNAFGEGYLPLHSALEMLSVVMGGAVFAVAWSSQSFSQVARLLIIGLAALGVSLLDFLHLLSYEGMPPLVTESGPEKAINFWLQARFLMVLGLLLAAWVPHRADEWLRVQSKYGWLTLVLLLVAVSTIWFLYFPEFLPSTFLEGHGLTSFKMQAEYVLIALYLLAAWGFCRHVSHSCVLKADSLAAASVIFAMGEFYLTRYASVTDLYNLLGHAYKIVAFVFLYQAVFHRLVREPFARLRETQTNLELTIDTLPDTLLELDLDGTVLVVRSTTSHPILSQFQGQTGVNICSLLPLHSCQRILDALQSALALGVEREVSVDLTIEGSQHYFDVSVARKPALTDRQVTFLVLVRDMTQQVLAQHNLELQFRTSRMLLRLDEKTYGKDESAFIRAAVNDIAELTDSALACIRLVDRESAQTMTFCSEDGQDLNLDVNEFWTHVLNATKPLVLNDSIEVAGVTSIQGDAASLRFVGVSVLEADLVHLMLLVGIKPQRYTQADVVVIRRLAESMWRGIKLRRQESMIRRLSSALGQSPYAVLITDIHSQIEYVNEAFCALSGYSPEEVIGKTPHILKSGQTRSSVYEAMWGNLNQGKTWQGELINRRKDGTTYTEEITIYPVRNSRGEITNYVGHKEDITRQKQTEARIDQLANYDQMTGLVNRQVLESTLDQLLTSSSEVDLPITVLWLDLDNFKAVNDSLGHDVGNLFLLEIANRLRLTLAPPVTLARVSGNGFVALLSRTDQQVATLLARRLLNLVQEPATLNGRMVTVGASIGMSIYPDDADSSTALLMAAETAMYRVKAQGRNNQRFFSPDMQENSLRSLEIASALSQVDMEEEFHMVYQPQMALHNGTVVGAEALLRWVHPVWGNVSPAEFIPIVEQTGRILDIGDWVLKHVIHQVAQWRQAGLGDFSVSINFSALQFVQDDMVQNMIDMVNQAGVPASCIEIELTETTAMNNPIAAGLAISALRHAGFLVSVDDFGTGYSSMSYLKRFAVNKIKIDRSFVQDLETNLDDQAIVRAITQMARTLGMKTIAEGVETAGQVEILKAKGCDEMQGYYYSYPLVAAEFEKFIRERL